MMDSLVESDLMMHAKQNGAQMATFAATGTRPTTSVTVSTFVY